jgi:hypothetical protein
MYAKLLKSTNQIISLCIFGVLFGNSRVVLYRRRALQLAG